ncbi:MAG: hypothetical protein ACRD3D_13480 [Terriglobia bacterium]
MAENGAGEQPLLGLDLVFDAGQRKLKEQLASVDSLDVKMGVLVGFLGALVAGLLAALLAGEPARVHALLNPSAWLGWFIFALLALDGILIALALGWSFSAFRVREHNAGIKFQDLLKWTKEDDKNIKFAFLRTLEIGIERNERILRQKGGSARNAAWFALAALLGILVTDALIVLRLKLYL